MTRTTLVDCCSASILHSLVQSSYDVQRLSAKSGVNNLVIAISKSTQRMGKILRANGFVAKAWFSGSTGSQLTLWVKNNNPRKPNFVPKK